MNTRCNVSTIQPYATGDILTEAKSSGIGEVEWLYKTSFDFDKSSKHTNAILTFEGLDTICDVYLVSMSRLQPYTPRLLTTLRKNGAKILATDNMFRTYTYPISLTSAETPLKATNTLLLHFKSAKALGKAEEAKYGKVRAGSTNLGDPSRVYVRKAQYDWRYVSNVLGSFRMLIEAHRQVGLGAWPSCP